jgi:purine-binding chemotaxis protein CheW
MGNTAERHLSDPQELVAFRVAGQDFCIDIMDVREIRGWTPATILPHAPEYVMGVINLRGSVVPIVNLAKRLNLATGELTARHVIIIAVIKQQIIGILVDAVSDILSIPSGAIQPTPNIASDATRAFVEGVIAVEDRMLRMLDLTAVLPQGEKDPNP